MKHWKNMDEKQIKFKKKIKKQKIYESNILSHQSVYGIAMK